jgi:sugar lactone lactonase YvrE
MSGAVERLAAVGARVGESPLWLPDRKLWLWLDLQGREVRLHDPATGTDRVIASGFAEDLACAVRWTPEAVLLVSVRCFFSMPLDGGPPEAMACPVDLPEGTIFNDGKVDRHGALWIGSSDAAEQAPLGRLWRIVEGRAIEIASGFVVSNGAAFSPDGKTAYFADTLGRRILRFSLDERGNPTSHTLFASIPPEAGYPDGMTVDRAGTLYVGHWDGARISRWSPAGDSLGDIAIPARNVTSLAFGGDDLSWIAITTAALFPGQVHDSEQPWNGDLLAVRAAIPGLIEPFWKAGP